MNLGNPLEITVNELAERIVDLTGASSSIDPRPLPADDPFQRQPDISLAKKELGWEPTVPLKKGLEQTIAYFETLLGNLAIA